jgi:FAD/FMN-containing dehydrogenase
MLFHATIGGLGLTGLITEVGLQLRPVKNGILDVETLKFKNLNELFSLTEQTDLDFEYTVAWIDSLATGSEVGRGHLIRANHNQTEGSAPISTKKPLLNVPFDMPKWVLNPLSIKAFNTLYYQKQQAPMTSGRVLYNPFFFPLDGVGGWNRFYGKPGFLQYQCVIPFSERSAVEEILRKIASSKSASFLSVLKNFGYKESLGLLSFPKPGITLALDFSNRGEKTFLFLEELDKIVQSAGGRLYPAKDARMSPATFQTGFPRWREFVAFIDPRFSSSFWRRVTAPNNLQMLSARGAF